MSSEIRPQRVLGQPIVLERAGKKKKKSRSVGEANDLERHMFRAMERTLGAGARGLRTYDKSRKKSKKKHRDGALVDLLPNAAAGMTVTATRLAPVPLDVMRAGYTPTARKMTRRAMRSVSRSVDRS